MDGIRLEEQQALPARIRTPLSAVSRLTFDKPISPAPALVDEALQRLPRVRQGRRLIINHIAVRVPRVLVVAGFESEWSMDAVEIDIVQLQSLNLPRRRV